MVQSRRRYRQVVQLSRNEGVSGIAERARRVASDWLAPRSAPAPVRREDLMAVDLAHPFHPPVPAIVPGEPLVANWVITPPAPGSGGHTTLFRILRYLEAHGYRNRVYFYDAYRSDHAYFESVVRNYYNFHGPVASIDGGMLDAHIVMATGWPTAYPIFNARSAGKRFYFIQDFEPLFYPAGTISSLAENTYRMGFHGISIGTCFADRLATQYGMTVDTFRYGCDISQYRRLPGSPRTGVVFYARRDNARRGFELGLMALEAFAARRPDIDIHIYGDKIGKLPFRFIDHGRISPDEINSIYNRCYAGLSLSFTNVSLVALEMLAAGCIPVVNDTPEVRTDLDNPFVRYAPAYPQALAAQLEAVLDTNHFDLISAEAAGSVHTITWDQAGATVDAILRRVLAAPVSSVTP